MSEGSYASMQWKASQLQASVRILQRLAFAANAEKQFPKHGGPLIDCNLHLFGSGHAYIQEHVLLAIILYTESHTLYYLFLGVCAAKHHHYP